jgi:hypothetical protein
MAHPTVISFARRLRPSPARFAAAAAWQDPSLLLQLRAARAEHPAARRRRGRLRVLLLTMLAMAAS